MNVFGIVFANDAAMGELTVNRTTASIPFGGRYRQIDFALSNLSGAGIHRIGLVSRHHYHSLMNHIGSGEEWGLELEEGGLEFLTPYATSATDSYRGKIESLHAAMNFLTYGEYDYVVLTDTTVLSNVDMRAVLESHAASGRDITIVTKAGIADGKKQIDLAIKLDEHGEIADMAVDYAAPADYVASMDIFVVGRDWLVQRVREQFARNLYHMDRDLVLGQWQKNALTINIYPFDGCALYNETVNDYYRNSMAIIRKAVRHDLFGANHLIYTKVRDRVPTYYGENCDVRDSILADGCVIEGRVVNSVLFRQVTVGEGSTVSDCVIMNDTKVGENCELRYVILDKDVTVRPNSKVIGTAASPVIIKRGEIV